MKIVLKVGLYQRRLRVLVFSHLIKAQKGSTRIVPHSRPSAMSAETRHLECEVPEGVPRTGFWNRASTLKQYFVLPKKGPEYYLKYEFLAFPVLGILNLSTPLEVPSKLCIILKKNQSDLIRRFLIRPYGGLGLLYLP